MGVIRVLPPGLVNRIAAGECVERPASVVKELVENALDAGASRIEITTLDGGRELISVSDDGGGISAEDLPLAIHPHATSKLLTEDDLFNIQTMGFRGEALASISSVARVTITSRPKDAELAQRLRIDGGEVSGPTPCAAAPGTTIEVRDLFYCVPARRKFLKTNQTESAQITEQFLRTALANPTVAFTLKSQNRVVHSLPSAPDALGRIRDFFGPELADVLLPVQRESNGVRVAGWVSPPKDSRGSGKWEYIFVNGRFIRDRFVSHAVKEAYRSLIDPSRYPVVFLFISIDPGHVDVNVHPTKIEVRWRDSNFIHAQTLAAIRDKFLATNLDHRLHAPPDANAYRERVREAMVQFFRGGPPTENQGSGSSVQREYGQPPAISTTYDRSAPGPSFAPGPPGVSKFQPDPFPTDIPPATFPRPAWNLQPDAPPTPSLFQPDVPTAGASPSDPPPYHGGSVPALQIHNTYLLVQTGDGLMIIDQHALHERILYEELRHRFANRQLESQRLLIPESLRVPPDRIEALETHAETLERLGIDLRASGPGDVTLAAYPPLLDRVNPTAFIRDLLDILCQPGARPNADTLIHSLLDMMACKAAVKAGDPLTQEEIAALLQRRDLAERSSHCPHGRPTTLHFSLFELEKQFKRR